MQQTTEPRIRNCPRCGTATEVIEYYIGGVGSVPHVVCRECVQDDGGLRILQRLPLNWRLLEQAEDEAFRVANREPANPGDWARALKVKAGIAAVVAVILVLVR